MRGRVCCVVCCVVLCCVVLRRVVSADQTWTNNVEKSAESADWKKRRKRNLIKKPKKSTRKWRVEHGGNGRRCGLGVGEDNMFKVERVNGQGPSLSVDDPQKGTGLWYGVCILLRIKLERPVPGQIDRQAQSNPDRGKREGKKEERHLYGALVTLSPPLSLSNHVQVCSIPDST